METIHTRSNMSVNRTASSITASHSLACIIANESLKGTGIEITSQKTAWWRHELNVKC